MRTVPAAAAAALLLALSGCSAATPQDALVERVEAVTERANAEDAEGLREAALALQDEVAGQRDAGDLSPEQAARLTALAASVREKADLVDGALQREQAEQAAREQAAREAAQREAAEQAAREAERQAQEQARQQAEREAAEQAAREAEREQDEDGGKGRGKKDEGDEREREED